jgi:TolB-like protein
VTDPGKAVFLSYASQDAEAAQRLCNALRAAGIEVWFDQSELRGGDAWDQSIRKQIKTCTLFLPIISKHTHERAEGYFRLEWKLAVDRSHLITAQRAFLVPVVIDDTGEDEEHVPDKFREVQWTHLPAGETPPDFATRIQQLLSGESSPSLEGTWRPAAATSGKPSHLKPVGLGLIVALVAIAGYLFIEKPWTAKAPPPAAFAPPPHSIGVLPFVNMSGDNQQEYFSDGLTEELLNSLARINELQVAARTSAFSFKGEKVDVETIAHKLNVGAILEGSVRRSGNTVRITAQLINGVTGFHMWARTYDRDLGDVLKLQTELADAVANALKVNLLDDMAAKIELGGTHNSAALDAYLHASKAYNAYHDAQDLLVAIAAYTEAIRLDPNYALALAGRSLAFLDYAEEFATGPAIRASFDKALADAREAVALAPDLAEGHIAMASVFDDGALDFARAIAEFERAVALAPGNARVLRVYGLNATMLGRTDAGITAAQRAVMLDPLNSDSYKALGHALYYVRRYTAAIASLNRALVLDRDDPAPYAIRGRSYYLLGDLPDARSSCEAKPDYWTNQICLAIVYAELGRHAEAKTALEKLQASMGDADAYQYAEVYTQWGDATNALAWLETAMRKRDPGLEELRVDPLLDPLRNEPRFQAIERELKFPK